jgi:hypothetical protein
MDKTRSRKGFGYTLILRITVLLIVILSFTSCSSANPVESQRQVIVFILDTGVDPQVLSDVEKLSIHDSYYIGEHGTDIARVLKEECDTCKLVSISLGGDYSVDGEYLKETATISKYELIAGLLVINDYLDEVQTQSPGLGVVAIINCSLGNYSSSMLEHLTIQILSDKGVIIVAAAGNEGDSKLLYPAAYPEVLAVAATVKSDKKAEYSNYGDWVDIAAYGYDMYLSQGDILVGGGTSISTPRVAGLLAEMLVRSQNTSPQEVVKVLIDTANPITGDPYFEKGWLGSGVIDAQEALDTIDPPTPGETVGRYLASWQAFVVYMLLGLILTLWLVNRSKRPRILKHRAFVSHTLKPR